MSLIRYLSIGISLLIPLACIRFTLVEGDVPFNITPTYAVSPTIYSPPTSIPKPSLIPPLMLTQTPTPTITTTPIYIPSPSPSIPFPKTTNFDQASIAALAFLEFDQFMITIQTPHPIEGEYSAMVDNTPFECLMIPTHPNFLYCVGPKPPYDSIVHFKLFPKGSLQPIYETDIHVPMEPLPTSTPRSK